MSSPFEPTNMARRVLEPVPEPKKFMSISRVAKKTIHKSMGIGIIREYFFENISTEMGVLTNTGGGGGDPNEIEVTLVNAGVVG